MIATAAAAAIFGAIPARGQSLGEHGQTYSIVEADMLATIERKAKEFVASGRYEQWKAESIERARTTFETPYPVPLDTASKYRKWLWDPSYTVPETVTDAKGNVVVRAGTSINPLDYVALAEALIFLDGRDEKQVQWAMQRAAERVSMLILTGGTWTELSRRLGTRMFFDQNGWMTAKFGIEAVPAVVSQEGRALAVEEIYLEP